MAQLYYTRIISSSPRLSLPGPSLLFSPFSELLFPTIAIGSVAVRLVVREKFSGVVQLSHFVFTHHPKL